MTGIEGLVREALRERVQDLSPMHDPAGGAIGRARVVRRRRARVAAGATALALVAALGGLTAWTGHRNDHPNPALPATGSPTAPATTGSAASVGAAPGAIVVGGTVLLLADGRTIPLGKVPGGVSQAYLGRDGWLLEGRGEGYGPTVTQSLWLLRPDGSLRPLLDRTDGPFAVATDGRRFAWRRDGRILLGHLTSAGDVTTDRSTAAPDTGFPVAIVGDTVVLGRGGGGDGTLTYDVWRSDRGAYLPTWDRMTHVLEVYGPAPDGHSLLGVASGPGGFKDPCLALLDPTNDLRVTVSICGTVLLGHNCSGPVSPDGRWMAVLSADAKGSPRLAVIDLTTVFTRPVITQSWASAALPAAWVDASTLIAVGQSWDGVPLRLHVGTTATESVPLPSGLPAPSSILWYRPVQTLPGLG